MLTHIISYGAVLEQFEVRDALEHIMIQRMEHMEL